MEVNFSPMKIEQEKLKVRQVLRQDVDIMKSSLSICISLKTEFVFGWDILIHFSQSDRSYSLKLCSSGFTDLAVVTISYPQHKTTAPHVLSLESLEASHIHVTTSYLSL